MAMDDQASPSRSEARAFFAERLRTLRVPLGYRTARSFAKALGIDENRYTRYERAEVEPDLGLIRRICALLSVTPNELLGVPAVARRAGSADEVCDSGVRPGTGRNNADRKDETAFEPPAHRLASVSRPMMAWAIGGLIANARLQHNAQAKTSAAPNEAFQRDASDIFAAIMQSPETTLPQLANEAALMAAGPDAIREFVTLCERFSKIAAP